MKRSATALQLHKLVQAHDSANFLTFLTASLQDSQSHGFLGNIILKCFFKNKNRNVILLMKMQYDAVSKRLRDGFALSAISNATK